MALGYTTCTPAATRAVQCGRYSCYAAGAKGAHDTKMPTFFLKGILVYYAAWKKHIGFYAIPSANAAFQDELSVYTVSKGAEQFPLDQSLPVDLITRMVRFRVEE